MSYKSELKKIYKKVLESKDRTEIINKGISVPKCNFLDTWELKKASGDTPIESLVSYNDTFFLISKNEDDIRVDEISDNDLDKKSYTYINILIDEYKDSQKEKTESIDFTDLGKRKRKRTIKLKSGKFFSKTFSIEAPFEEIGKEDDMPQIYKDWQRHILDKLGLGWKIFPNIEDFSNIELSSLNQSLLLSILDKTIRVKDLESKGKKYATRYDFLLEKIIEFLDLSTHIESVFERVYKSFDKPEKKELKDDFRDIFKNNINYNVEDLYDFRILLIDESTILKDIYKKKERYNSFKELALNQISETKFKVIVSELQPFGGGGFIGIITRGERLVLMLKRDLNSIKGNTILVAIDSRLRSDSTYKQKSIYEIRQSKDNPYKIAKNNIRIDIGENSFGSTFSDPLWKSFPNL